MERSDRQKQGNSRVRLHPTPNGTAIYRIFHPTAAEHTFFSVEHGTCSRIHHITGTKQVPTKF